MEEKRDIIDLKKIFRKVIERRKLFYWVWPIVFVLACLAIVPVPRYYVSTVKLAPELDNSSGGAGALSSIASQFGFDLGNVTSTDAISPLMYPDVFESNDFIVSLFDIPVKTLDGTVQTTYYDYLRHHQKDTYYKVPINWVKRQIKKLMPKPAPRPASAASAKGKVDPFMLTEEQDLVAQGIKHSISCAVDKKTVVISISVTDQDPLVCATLCDSLRSRLQKFITEYRTQKAHVDYEHYAQLTEEAKKDYEAAIHEYSRFVDAHQNVILQSYISHRDELENDMQVKFNTYTAMQSQMQAANAKVQERTPAFTLLQRASVPFRPAGPKRMLFVIGMLILATFGTILYILKDDILRPFKSEE